MAQFSFSSLRTRLLFLVSLAVIPGLILALYTASEQREHAAIEAQQGALRLARVIASDHERLIEGGHQLLVGLAQLPSVTGKDSATCSRFLAGLLKHFPHYANLGAVTVKGDVFCSAIPFTGKINIAEGALGSCIRRTLENQGFGISDYTIGKISQKPAIVFGYPALDASGQIQAIVYASLDLASLNRQAQIRNPTPGTTISLIDQNGTVLVRHPEPDQWVGKSMAQAPIIRTIFAQKEGTAELPGMDGVSRLFGFTHLRGVPKGTEMYVSVGIPGEIAFAEANRISRNNLVGLGFVTLLALASAWVAGSLLILRRMKVLVDTTKRLGAGDMAARTGVTRQQDEIGLLARSFDEMADALQTRQAKTEQTEQVLRDNAERLRMMVEQIPAVLWTTDLDLKFTSATGAGLANLNLNTDQVVGMSLYDYLHTDDPSFLPIAMHRQALSGKSVSYEMSWMGRAFQVHLEPLLDTERRIVGTIEVALDITERKRAEEALRESERRLATLLKNLPGYAYRCRNDRDWTLEFISEGVYPLTGYPVQDYLEKRSITCGEKIHPDDRDRVWNEVQRALKQRQPFEMIYRITTRSGEEKWVWERGQGTFSPEGELMHIEGFVTDITERKRAVEAIERLQRQNELILSSAGEGICGIDLQGKITFVNPATAKMLGYEVKELVGQHIHPSLHVSDTDAAVHLWEDCPIYKTLRDGIAHHIAEEIFFRKDGTSFPVEYVSTPIREQDSVAGAVVVFRDITWRKAQIAALEYHALHDSLTNLPNRVFLRDRLQQAILSAQEDKRPVVFMLMDLDRFKEINDTLGHHYGDLLLQQVGARLRAVVWDPDVVARLGGDEFAIVLPRMAAPEHINVVIHKVLETLSQPFLLDGFSLEVRASIGVALFPEHGPDADTLMRRADVAMYTAKQANTGYAIYSPDLDHYSPDRLAIMAELRRGIEKQQMVLHYQPKIDLRNRRLIGVEALVRWQHPTRGIIPPDQFIALAEQTGLIKPLTFWVLSTALHQCYEWHRQGLEIRMAVNLSAQSLRDEQLPEQVTELLRTHGTAPDWLELEITESSIMTDAVRSMAILTSLGHIGVQLSIDDFGTGYSSLANLKKLPVDTIKIDKSFVMDMVTDEDAEVIVKSTIDLARNLRLQVVAEGVENKETWDRLTSLGCDAVQGYYISPPLPADEFSSWLHNTPWISEIKRA